MVSHHQNREMGPKLTWLRSSLDMSESPAFSLRVARGTTVPELDLLLLDPNAVVLVIGKSCFISKIVWGSDPRLSRALSLAAIRLLAWVGCPMTGPAEFFRCWCC